MIFQLSFNIIIAVFLVYCYFYIGTANSANISPGDIGEAAWPQTLIVLALIFLVLNIVTLIKKMPKEEKEVIKFNASYFMDFFKSKLFVGMAILVVYSQILQFLGFVVSSLLLFVAYARLLGEKDPKKLAIVSVIAITIFYIVFGVGLGIMLPRGQGVFRTFALFLESLF